VWIAIALAVLLPVWFVGLVLWSWSVKPPLGLVENQLRPCPDKPNCVCSLATESRHAIDSLPLGADPAADWARLKTLVAQIPRARVVTATDDYLHAECATALMRYVDDLEFHLRPSERRIDVRSASRVGYSDLNANRQRVEAFSRLWLETSSR
jgi:uncharacterized protein (DUF1499 family)